MRSTITRTLALVLFALPALAGPSLTLYTTDLGLVKESRRVVWQGGRDALRLEGVSTRLDATSLRLVPDAGRLARLAYRWDVASGDGPSSARSGSACAS
jgi:hypothetical protein